MDYPVAEKTTDKLFYDPEARIVINNNNDYNPQQDLEYLSAKYLSQQIRISEHNQRKLGDVAIKIDSVRDYLLENYEYIGSEYSDEIASLLDIQLSQTVEVKFDVTITATVTLPIGKDFSDLSVYDFDVEFGTNEKDYEIEEYDAEIERMIEA